MNGRKWIVTVAFGACLAIVGWVFAEINTGLMVSRTVACELDGYRDDASCVRDRSTVIALGLCSIVAGVALIVGGVSTKLLAMGRMRFGRAPSALVTGDGIVNRKSCGFSGGSAALLGGLLGTTFPFVNYYLNPIEQIAAEVKGPPIWSVDSFFFSIPFAALGAVICAAVFWICRRLFRKSSA